MAPPGNDAIEKDFPFLVKMGSGLESPEPEYL